MDISNPLPALGLGAILLGIPIRTLINSAEKRSKAHEESERKRKNGYEKARRPPGIATPSEPSNTQSCDICASDLPPTHFPLPIDIPYSCKTHCRNICSACLSSSLQTAIANKPITRIGCPVCDSPWDRHFIEMHAGTASLGAYYRLELVHFLETLPEFRACQSPTCDSGQLHASGASEPIVVCEDCGFRSCFVHRMPWHNGMTCAQYDARKQEERERDKRVESKDYRKMFGKGVKPCPNCRSPIQKKGGCDHMSCWKCRHEFCWICAAAQERIRDQGNHLHDRSCDHYRPSQRPEDSRAWGRRARSIDPHYWRDAGTVQPDGSRAVGEPLYDPRHAEARRRDILEHYVGGRNSGRGAEKTWRDRVRAVRDMVYETREDEARRRDGGEGYPGV